VAGNARQHRSEKRRKELTRQAKQKEKRDRRAGEKPGEPGGGPPIDWGEVPPEAPRPDEPEAAADPAPPEEPRA
jgi:hypothetical protein